MKKTIIALSIFTIFNIFAEEPNNEYTKIETKEYVLDIHDSLSGSIISLFNMMKSEDIQSGEVKTILKTEYVVDKEMEEKLAKFKNMLNEKVRSNELKQTFHFKTAKSNLLSEQINYLKNVVLSLEDYENLQYEVIGYSDARGNEEYNYELSTQRTNTIVYILNELGINNSNITSNNLGETQSEKNQDVESYFFDRKVELIIKK